MDALVREGVTSFKLFMAYPGVFCSTTTSIFRAMLRAGELGALICMHAENGAAIDVLVQQALGRGPHRADLSRADAARACRGRGDAQRAIALAEMADVPVYIVHLSAERALERVMEARDRGLPAYAETCPQYLFLSEDIYAAAGTSRARSTCCTPPLRPKRHQDQLWRGLREQRPAGRLDRSLPVLHEGAEGARPGRLLEDPERHARHRDAHEPHVGRRRARRAHLAEPLRRDHVDAPAKIFGLFPKKGTIAVGADADLVVLDPSKKTTLLSDKTLHMNVDYTPYEGREVTGTVDTVVSRGRVVIDAGLFTGRAGAGSFLKRSAR